MYENGTPGFLETVQETGKKEKGEEKIIVKIKK
jgi:hypothetical protein